MEDMHFNKCAGDECLLMRQKDIGTVVICVYIDNTLCAGDKITLDNFKGELRNFFATKEEGTMDEYVGCQIKRIHKNCIIIHQADLLKKLERIFKTDIKDLKVREMPLGTNNRVMRPKDDETLISSDAQTNTGLVLVCSCI